MTDQLPFHLALIAHDGKKDALVALVKPISEVLQACRIVTTATTGQVLEQQTGLKVHRLLSGPRGGDLQIGSLVAVGMIERLIFLRDPLMAHPHEPDIAALMKVCDIYEVPLATNRATADLLLQDVKAFWTK
jgi:methylglyoxal synthase